MADEWRGTNPYYLLIRHRQDTDDALVATVVDLDEPGWATIHTALMRKPGRWYLVDKATNVMPVAMLVEEGDQPYYVARHVGMGSGVRENTIQSESVAYGIGKKRPDGTVERLWHFYEGVTVTGEDVYAFGIEVAKTMNAIKLARREAERAAKKEAARLRRAAARAAKKQALAATGGGTIVA